jgi:hypothetical protein
LLRVVGIHPIHETKHSHAAPAFEEDGMKYLFFVGLLEARHHNTNATHVVGRISFQEAQENAFAPFRLDNHLARRFFNFASISTDIEFAFALVENRISTRR